MKVKHNSFQDREQDIQERDRQKLIHNTVVDEYSNLRGHATGVYMTKSF